MLHNIDTVAALVAVCTFLYAIRKYLRKHDRAFDAIAAFLKWQEIHEKECDDNRRRTADMLEEMQATNAGVAILVKSHHERLDRIERIQDSGGRH